MSITRLLPSGVNTSASFTLGNVTTTGNVTSTNANLGNLATANYFHGTFDSSSNSQPNVTSLGSLTGLTISGTTLLQQVSEVVATPGGTTFDFTTGAVFYTTSATVGANFTPSFTNIPTSDNRSTIVSITINQGSTPYMPTLTTAVNINGSSVTVKWSSGVIPTGRANTLQVVTYSILKISGTWYVSGQSSFFS